MLVAIDLAFPRTLISSQPVRLALLLSLGLLGCDGAEASARDRHAYIAVGTSETDGYGLRNGAPYPALVAQRCRWTVKINAEVAGSTLLLPDQAFAGVVSIFWSPDFAMYSAAAREGKRARSFLRKTHAIHVFMLLPPDLREITALRSVPSSVLSADRAARQHIVAAASRRISIIKLPAPRAADTIDGLHPSPRGQEAIASRIVRRAISASVCDAAAPR